MAERARTTSRERLEELRGAIEALDARLVKIIAERRALVLEVGRIKQSIPVGEEAGL